MLGSEKKSLCSIVKLDIFDIKIYFYLAIFKHTQKCNNMNPYVTIIQPSSNFNIVETFCQLVPVDCILKHYCKIFFFFYSWLCKHS